MKLILKHGIFKKSILQNKLLLIIAALVLLLSFPICTQAATTTLKLSGLASGTEYIDIASDSRNYAMLAYADTYINYVETNDAKALNNLVLYKWDPKGQLAFKAKLSQNIISGGTGSRKEYCADIAMGKYIYLLETTTKYSKGAVTAQQINLVAYNDKGKKEFNKQVSSQLCSQKAYSKQGLDVDHEGNVHVFYDQEVAPGEFERMHNVFYASGKALSSLSMNAGIDAYCTLGSNANAYMVEEPKTSGGKITIYSCLESCGFLNVDLSSRNLKSAEICYSAIDDKVYLRDGYSLYTLESLKLTKVYDLKRDTKTDKAVAYSQRSVFIPDYYEDIELAPAGRDKFFTVHWSTGLGSRGKMFKECFLLTI